MGRRPKYSKPEPLPDEDDIEARIARLDQQEFQHTSPQVKAKLLNKAALAATAGNKRYSSKKETLASYVQMTHLHRLKIQNSKILDRVIGHVEADNGGFLSATQVTAALGLLKKVLPDLAAQSDVAADGSLESKPAEKMTNAELAEILKHGRDLLNAQALTQADRGGGGGLGAAAEGARKLN